MEAAPLIADGPFAGLRHHGFTVVVADPPWYFKTRTAVVSNRDPQQHYPIMRLSEIKALPVSELASPDGCHLFLWTTGPCLPQAFEVIAAWGFRYSGVAFNWIKLKRSFEPNQFRLVPTTESDVFVGLGFTTRKSSELCLLARRGAPKRHSRSVREAILSPVREHSRKPEEARVRIEAYAGPNARIVELFARSTRPGWSAWGNDTSHFPPAAA